MGLSRRHPGEQGLSKQPDATAQRRPAARATAAAGAGDSSRSGFRALDPSDGQPPGERSGAVIVVTGLPRAGTSMMMQVLEAAGIPLYKAGPRIDPNWLAEARGRAVKITTQFLDRLPAGERYRIVFVHRHPEEVAVAIDAEVLAVNYARALADPMTTVSRLAAFLGEPFDRMGAAGVIDPKLLGCDA